MRQIFIILLFFIFPITIYAQNTINIDNESIQEYKGITGKWILTDSRKLLLSLAKTYSGDIENVTAINEMGKNFTKKYYFFPFSESYLMELEKSNIIRETKKSGEKEFIWPVSDPKKTSSVLGFRNGKFHPGLDLPMMKGAPILACMEGLVVFTGYDEGYGRLIVIRHKNNFITRYAHNSVNLVKKGDFVQKGQIIGLVGSTGRSTGNHLHFELRCGDIPLDPLDFFPYKSDLQVVHTLKNWK